MARLDVYRMPGKPGRGYVVDVQADLLSDLRTRTVVPLLPVTDMPAPIRQLNPVFDIAGEPHVLLTQAIVSIPAKELRVPIVSLRDRHDVVMGALDVLLVGF